MTLKKIHLFIFLFFAGLLPNSCCLTNSCGCSHGKTATTARITNMEIDDVDLVGNSIVPSLSYDYDEIFKRVHFEDLELISEINSDHVPSGYLMACSPDPILIENPIEFISVQSESEFIMEESKKLFKPGDDIFEILLARKDYRTYATVKDMIDSAYWSTEGPHFDLGLKYRPLVDSEIILSITINLIDGSQYQFLNQRMNIN